MPKVDVSGLGIRVILDPRFYCEPCKKGPLDVEGTVLYVLSHDRRASRMVKEGSILELIFNAQYRGLADVYIRWDTDEKEWFSTGYMLLRKAKIGFCVNIWSNASIEIDSRPYHELKPQYYSPPPTYSFGEAKWTSGAPVMKLQVEHTLYGSVQAIPQNGYWHKCDHEGVLSLARKTHNGYEVREDSLNAPIRFIDYSDDSPDVPSIPEPAPRAYRSSFKHYRGLSPTKRSKPNPRAMRTSPATYGTAVHDKEITKAAKMAAKIAMHGKQYTIGKPIAMGREEVLEEFKTSRLSGDIYVNYDNTTISYEDAVPAAKKAQPSLAGWPELTAGSKNLKIQQVEMSPIITSKGTKTMGNIGDMEVATGNIIRPSKEDIDTDF